MSRAALFVAALTVPLAAAAAQAPAGTELAVIVHPRTTVAGLTVAELRRVFLAERKFWGDQTRITLFIMPTGTPARSAALRLVYRMTENEYRQYWVAKIFRAEVTAGPRVVADGAQAVRLVANTPGAIALVPAAAVDASVTVLRIDGRLPPDRAYPLR